MPTLTAQKLTLAYETGGPVVRDLELTLEPGSVTSLIGPNGCGKSTLLRALTRLLPPRKGSVLLSGEDIHRLPTRLVAQKLGLLAQHADAPGGLTVAELVRRGRYPHRGPWEPLGTEDEKAVEAALVRCTVDQWRDRPVDELSGGQRQRVWIALALAQDTPVILMDEPTTFLDPRHQTEVMDLVHSLHTDEGKTLVLVLHDLAQAAAVSRRIIVMNHGKVAADGPPADILTPAFLQSVYGVPFEVGSAPVTGAPVPRPLSRLDLTRGPCALPGAPVVQARSLSAGYGGVPVIGPLDLTFGPGFSVLLGPNGGGKSTLLRTLAGLHPALTGEVRVDGRPVGRGGRAAALGRAFLSQEAAAPPGVTVAALAALGRHPHRHRWGGRRPEDRLAVSRALELLGLEDLADQPVDRLSGGQRQRVWLALALTQESPLILLDEPTSFLDPGHQIELLDALWRLTREGPRTIVAILHDPDLAARYADFVVALPG